MYRLGASACMSPERWQHHLPPGKGKELDYAQQSDLKRAHPMATPAAMYTCTLHVVPNSQLYGTCTLSLRCGMWQLALIQVKIGRMLVYVDRPVEHLT